MKALFSWIVVLTAFSTSLARAETFDGEKARNLVTALYNSGAPSIKDGDYIHYKFKNVECKASWHGNEDISNPLFNIPTFECTVERCMFGGTEAQVIFTALADAVGSDSGMDSTWTRAQELECKVDLTKSLKDSRFACVYTPFDAR